MRLKPIILLFLILCLVPVISSAQNLPFYPEESEQLEIADQITIVYDSSVDNLIISRFYVNIPPNTNYDFTLYFNDGTTKAGRVDFYQTNLGVTNTLDFNLDGVTSTRDAVWNPVVNPSIGIVYYNEMNTTDWELHLIDTWNYAPHTVPVSVINITSPAVNPIIMVEIVSENNPITAKFFLVTPEELSTTAERYEMQYEEGQNFVTFVINNIVKIKDTLMFLWDIFSFIFIENLVLVILLIEGAIVAYRLNSSPNIFIAMSKIFTDNEKLLTGIIGFISAAVKLAWDVVNLINPMRWIFGNK